MDSKYSQERTFRCTSLRIRVPTILFAYIRKVIPASLEDWPLLRALIFLGKGYSLIPMLE